jgi:CheY-like chemotaxis protein
MHNTGDSQAPSTSRLTYPDIKHAASRDSDATRTRLETERIACEHTLANLNAQLQGLQTVPHRPDEEAETISRGRLRRLASMSPDLRTPMHMLLGHAQLMRLEGGLTPAQMRHLDAMLTVGTHLLETLYAALNLSDVGDDAAPALPPAVRDAPVGTPSVTAVSAPGLHVLVVDDIAMNLDIAAAFLRAAGHTATLCDTAAAAIDAAASADFDVILMDVRMPEMDGLEATRRIRALPGHRCQVPIVALTALAFLDEVEDCRRAGMNGHLAKPFRHDTLNDAILRATAARAPAPTGSGPPAGIASADPPPAAPVVSLAASRWRTARAGAPSPSHLRAVAADGRLADQSRQANAAPPLWLDIQSPWASMPGGAPPGGRSIIPDVAFDLRLTAAGTRHSHRLVDSKLTCEPPPERDQHEFHWLLFVDQVAGGPHAFNAACDLWRWSRGAWRSTTVPGASFTPDEMYDQGWRYCGPCVDKTARVVVLDGE